MTTLAAKHVIPTGKVYLDSAELTPDGREVLVGGFAGVYTIDVASGKETRRYRKNEHNVVWQARMTRDGARVVAGNGGCELDIWAAKTKKRTFALGTDDRIVMRLSLSRDGKRAVTAAGNTNLAFWDLEKGKSLGGTATKKSFVVAAAISPDGKRALYGGTDGVVRLFDCARSEDVASSPGKGWIESIDSCDAGTYASAGRDKRVMLWDERAKPIRTLRGLSRTITCVSLSPDGARVAAAAGGRPIVWDTKGSVLAELDAEKCAYVRFSHDGASIAALGDGFVRVYETP